MVNNYGPLPAGTYTIGSEQDNVLRNGKTRDDSMRLYSDPGTWTYERGGLLIHDDNGVHNHSASEGCIVMDKKIRNKIGNSHDHILRVVP